MFIRPCKSLVNFQNSETADFDKPGQCDCFYRGGYLGRLFPCRSEVFSRSISIEDNHTTSLLLFPTLPGLWCKGRCLVRGSSGAVEALPQLQVKAWVVWTWEWSRDVQGHRGGLLPGRGSSLDTRVVRAVMPCLLPVKRMDG